MKVCVQGLWHLGSVTAACLAKLGHEVVGLDPDVKAVGSLTQGRAPLFEPGLDALGDRQWQVKFPFGCLKGIGWCAGALGGI